MYGLKFNGLNCTVTINNVSINNGSLTFYETDGNKISLQDITNYTEKNKSYSINITKSGNYTFRLQDNTNKKFIEISKAITLANKPKINGTSTLEYNYGETSEKWAYIDNYVWIPRFAYKINTQTNEIEQIKFIKGNSNIATDNTYINDNWIVNNKFKDSEGTELTGIWIQTTSPHQEGLNMIELLNSDAETLQEINI